MARLIVKSPCFKSGSKSVSGYLRYIATRDRVEILPDDRPPTKRQEQLISKLTHDFPDSKNLIEYADWQASPTKAHASAFISSALECHWTDVSQSEIYMKYIATRPRAERLGTHGLFGDEDRVDLQKSIAELDRHDGNVWTHIISLKREDAARLGFDNAKAWRDLLRTHRNDIAAAMKISPDHFRWYAAFHDEGDHPHVHMMAWSSEPKEGYLNQNGIRQIKSALTNQIFHQELLHIYEQKGEFRDDLVRQARKAMLDLAKCMEEGICVHPEVEDLMLRLAKQLDTVKGKKKYGYLPKSLKALVDEIVDQMERLPVVADCYKKWWTLQCQIEDFYSEQERHQPPLSQQKEFRAIKNAVIREAEQLRQNVFTFEDKDLAEVDEAVPQPSYSCQELLEIIHDGSLPLDERDAAVSELEHLAEKRDKGAAYQLGKLWRDGPVPIPDSVNARYWFQQAAQHHVVPAQYALGQLYLSDDVAVHDAAEGLWWLEIAAKNHNSSAAYQLGKEYLRGKFAAQDTEKARRFLQQSAEAGNAPAQYTLGKLYLLGQHINQDKDAARFWLTQSADQGNQYAALLLERMEKTETPTAALAVTRILHHMSRIFRDNALPQSSSGGIHIDRKRLQQLRERKIALGHRADDHEDQSYTGSTMDM